MSTAAAKLLQSCLTVWTIACQAPLSMGLSRQEYCNGLPCLPPGDLPPGDLPHPGIKSASLMSPALAGRFFTTSARSPYLCLCCYKWHYIILFMAEQYFIVYLYHISFICSSADGHLGWFHGLAIVDSATKNIGVHLFFFSFLSFFFFFWHHSFVWIYAE